MVVKERPVCPLCGGYKIEERLVPKEKKPEYKDISFDEHAEQCKKEIPGFPFISGDIHIAKLDDYAQLVLTCEDCGYTKVFPIEKGGV